MSAAEDGAPEAGHRDPSQLRPEGCERHRAVTGPNCGCLSRSVPEASFNRRLKFLLLLLLGSTVMSVIIFEQILFPRSNGASSWDISDQTEPLSQEGIVPLAMFAAVVAVGAFARKATKSTGSAPPRREEEQTISAPVQQV